MDDEYGIDQATCEHDWTEWFSIFGDRYKNVRVCKTCKKDDVRWPIEYVTRRELDERSTNIPSR